MQQKRPKLKGRYTWTSMSYKVNATLLTLNIPWHNNRIARGEFRKWWLPKLYYWISNRAQGITIFRNVKAGRKFLVVRGTLIRGITILHHLLQFLGFLLLLTSCVLPVRPTVRSQASWRRTGLLWISPLCGQWWGWWRWSLRLAPFLGILVWWRSRCQCLLMPLVLSLLPRSRWVPRFLRGVAAQGGGCRSALERYRKQPLNPNSPSIY